MDTFTNHGKTINYTGKIIKPKDINELKNISKMNYCVLGGGHSFINLGSKKDCYVDMSNFKNVICINTKQNLLTVESGIKIYEIENFLKKYKKSIFAVGSTRGQTIGGATANCVNSPGGFLSHTSDIVKEINYFDKNGNFKRCNGKNIHKYAVHLGCLCGLIYSFTIKISDYNYCKIKNFNIKFSELQNYLSCSYNDNKLHELIYSFSDKDNVAVVTYEPFSDKNKNDIEVPSYLNSAGGDSYSIAFGNNFIGRNLYKFDDKFYKLLVNYTSINRVNELRTELNNKDNKTVHFSKAWSRQISPIENKHIPYTFIEFYVPINNLYKVINILDKIYCKNFANIIQIRPFHKSKAILSPSYGYNCVSILMTITLNELDKHKYIITVLNRIGVRYHWGCETDDFYYPGYIERVYGKKVADEMKYMIYMNSNYNIVRDQIKLSLEKCKDKTCNWDKLINDNLDDKSFNQYIKNINNNFFEKDKIRRLYISTVILVSIIISIKIYNIVTKLTTFK